jgi:large-conductance mechanosensitive channel
MSEIIKFLQFLKENEMFIMFFGIILGNAMTNMMNEYISQFLYPIVDKWNLDQKIKYLDTEIDLSKLINVTIKFFIMLFIVYLIYKGMTKYLI